MNCYGPVDKTLDSKQKILSSNPLGEAVVPLGKAFYPHCQVPQRGLKTIGPLIIYLQAACFLYKNCKMKYLSSTYESSNDMDFKFIWQLKFHDIPPPPKNNTQEGWPPPPPPQIIKKMGSSEKKKKCDDEIGQ